MTREEQRRKAEEFLSLHHRPAILVLPNAWDVVSARIFELEGFKAVGTTSAGISATLGYPDGERIKLEDTVEAVRRIAARISIPVSADIEAGYSTSVEGVAIAARGVLQVGAVGLNLEDSTGNPSAPLYEPAAQAEKIKGIRELALSEGIPLVINARTDVYLLSDNAPADRLRETVKRAHAYCEAGADCIFVPDIGQLDKDTIAGLVREIPAPVNVIAGETTPPLAQLEEIGVARVSFGPRPMRALLALLRKIVREWRETGTYTTMLADTLSYSEVNQMFDY